MPLAPTASQTLPGAVGPAQARLLSGILLGVAAVALWLAVPRLMAGIAIAPHSATLASLDKTPLPSLAAQERALSAHRRALSWYDNPQSHAALGALELAAAARAPIADASAVLERSIAEHRAALALAPLQPYAWARLVQGELTNAGPSNEAAGHLRMAVVTAPWEPALMTARLGLAFALWGDLDEATRTQLDLQIRHAARLYPASLARQARARRAQEHVLQALSSEPDLLRRFSQAYSRI